MPTTRPNHLRLDLIAGPDIGPLVLTPDRPAVLGRSADCEVRLHHEAVSRRHAAIAFRLGRWLVTDQGSRHGTYLNEVRIEPGKPVSLADGDFLRLGPWTFRATVGGARVMSTITLTDAPPGGERVERVQSHELGILAQQRLALLMDCAATINASADETSLARASLRSALEGSGFERAAWLRPTGSEAQVEVLAAEALDGAADGFSFSRSLIREAAGGQIARLTGDSPIPTTHSIWSLGIHSALCAPVHVGGSVAAFLYMDARGPESHIQPDAAGFCRGLAGICGLALANLKRMELEKRQQFLETELAAARHAQQLIMPAPQGRVGRITYALHTHPGLFVAGDLFDIVQLGGDRIALCIGDVSGEGIGAGVLMASAQAFLHAALCRYEDPAAAVAAVNAYLCDRTSAGRFVTLWVGLFDPADGSVRYVDAGHGYSLLASDGGARRISGSGGIPIGIDPGFAYRHDVMKVEAGNRLVLFSDGLVEQRSPAGEQFGFDRIAAALARSATPSDDVAELFRQVRQFAGTEALDDDATAASIEIG